jgi:hypothetical protein
MNDMKDPRTKAQAPEKLQISSSKLRRGSCIGAWCLVLLWSVGLGTWSFAGQPVLYTNNFEKAAVDSVPDDMLVLDGAFAVKQENGNKFLELPGAPLDTFGVLFGPATNANVAVEAKIYGTGKGRRYPSFGVGLNGAGGYKLKVSPSKNALELYKGDELLASAPFKWKSGTWTTFRLHVIKSGEGEWAVMGKVWDSAEKPPENFQVTVRQKIEPTAGRPSIFGSPISGTPIRFDDLALLAAPQATVGTVR